MRLVSPTIRPHKAFVQVVIEGKPYELSVHDAKCMAMNLERMAERVLYGAGIEREGVV